MIIEKKRDGRVLSQADLEWFARAVAGNTASDAHIAALAMAIFLNGMSMAERVGLTVAMRDSGRVFRWPDLPGPVLDKHSTGGVGDNVSLILAPALAACGAFVPMISGRGLGHTGGTLDKLSAIPGYCITPGIDLFCRVVKKTGCAIIGQTPDIAPADGRFYAVRDATATVESIDLVTASIVSKKLSEGLSALVLDVKCGNGAFMTGPGEARALAQSLVAVANGAGCRTSALITAMDQPLANAAGNALEVDHAVRFLLGASDQPRLARIVGQLGGTVLHDSAICASREQGARRIDAVLQSGQAAARFAEMVAALGGPSGFVEKPGDFLARAPIIRPVFADRPGYVTQIDTRALGHGVIALGGGRRAPEDRINPSVGFDALCATGEEVTARHPLAMVHAASEDGFERAAHCLRTACKVSEERPPPPHDPILAHIAAPGHSDSDGGSNKDGSTDGGHQAPPAGM